MADHQPDQVNSLFDALVKQNDKKSKGNKNVPKRKQSSDEKVMQGIQDLTDADTDKAAQSEIAKRLRGR